MRRKDLARYNVRRGSGKSDLKTALQRLEAEVDASPLTAREVAELCGVELKTVHNWAADELIEHFRTPGRHLRFRPADVTRFLQACGYRLPEKNGKLGTTLVLAKGSTRSALRRALKGLPVTWVGDPYSALVQAGSLAADAVILEARLVPPAEARAYLAAVVRSLPNTRLFWISASPPLAKTRGIQVVATQELQDIRGALKESA